MQDSRPRNELQMAAARGLTAGCVDSGTAAGSGLQAPLRSAEPPLSDWGRLGEAYGTLNTLGQKNCLGSQRMELGQGLVASEAFFSVFRP